MAEAKSSASSRQTVAKMLALYRSSAHKALNFKDLFEKYAEENPETVNNFNFMGH